MPYVIVNHGRASGPFFADTRDEDYGWYLMTFDPEFQGGLGFTDWTPHLENALRYESIAKALAAWNTRSKSRPNRPDGRPNKPMTAYTVEFLECPSLSKADERQPAPGSA